jgi:hypothetical protein
MIQIKIEIRPGAYPLWSTIRLRVLHTHWWTAQLDKQWTNNGFGKNIYLLFVYVPFNICAWICAVFFTNSLWCWWPERTIPTFGFVVYNYVTDSNWLLYLIDLDHYKFLVNNTPQCVLDVWHVCGMYCETTCFPCFMYDVSWVLSQSRSVFLDPNMTYWFST